MTELLPCPFCGGEAYTAAKNMPNWTWNWCSVICDCCGAKVSRAGNEGTYQGAEKAAIAAWNTRAAYEMDGWFYLPKPKQQLFSYTTGFSFDDLSLKSTGTVDVYVLTRAVQKWQEEALNARIIERICEVFKPERTCHWELEHSGTLYDKWRCSKCGYLFVEPRCDQGYTDLVPNYCPNCGAKVVGE